MILLKSRTTVVGPGRDTIIVEPPRTGWIVFQSCSKFIDNVVSIDPNSPAATDVIHETGITRRDEPE